MNNLAKGLLVVMLVIAIAFFGGWIVWLFWPVALVLGLPSLTYMQCVGLFCLTSALFKTSQIWKG